MRVWNAVTSLFGFEERFAVCTEGEYAANTPETGILALPYSRGENLSAQEDGYTPRWRGQDRCTQSVQTVTAEPEECTEKMVTDSEAFPKSESVVAIPVVDKQPNAEVKNSPKNQKRGRASSQKIRPGTMLDKTLKSFSSVVLTAIAWLWNGVIPLGFVTILYGMGGIGKSFLLSFIAAVVSQGWKWPDGTLAPPGEVLLINSEDDLGSTIKARMQSHGANQERVHVFSSYVPPQDIPSTVSEILVAKPGIKLVVMERLLDDLSSSSAATASEVLGNLEQIAGKHQVAVIAVAHERKNSNGNGFVNILGSTAIANVVRMIWSVTRDAGDSGLMLLCNEKNNLSPERCGFAFRIIDGCVTWEDWPKEMDVDVPEAVVIESSPIIDFLRTELADGPMKSTDVFSAGRKAGFSASQISRAATKLAVKREKE